VFGKWPSQLVPFPCCIRRISLAAAAAAAVALSSHVSLPYQLFPCRIRAGVLI
jgi:hypothetical protein